MTDRKETNGNVQKGIEPGLAGQVLWKHQDPISTQMYTFMRKINQKYSLSLKRYAQLHEWSCQHPAAFWEEIYQLADIGGEKGANGQENSKVS